MLIELQKARGGFEPPGKRKHMLEHQSRNPVRRTLRDDRRARVFHHLTEMHAGGAGGFAGAAIQTLEHVLDERIGDLCPAFVERAHQVDSAARRIHLAAEYAVCRARRQTKATMNAVQVELLFSAIIHHRCAFQGSDVLQDRISVFISCMSRFSVPRTPNVATLPAHFQRRSFNYRGNRSRI